MSLVWFAATVDGPSVGIAAGSPQPFAIGFAVVNSHPNNFLETNAKVPAGIRWTIQNISIVCFMPNGASISSLQITTSTNGVVTGITPTVPEGRFYSNNPYPRAIVQLSQPTLTYADPGTLVALQANLQTTAPTNQFSCAADLMGLATPTAGAVTGGITTGSGTGALMTQ
jgi:hypothetical protein